MSVTYPLTLLASCSFEDNVRRWAEIYQSETKDGQGFFFDFDITPDFKNAVINWMQHYYGWSLEYDDTFLRKPKAIPQS